MRVLKAVFLSLMVALLSFQGGGCSSIESIDPTAGIAPLLGIGAAAITYKSLQKEVDDGDMTSSDQALWTAAAAGITYIAAEHIRGKYKQEVAQAMVKGQALGMSDVAKRQYWEDQDRQRDDESLASNRTSIKYYDFQGAAVGQDGTNYVNHNVRVRMEE